ncbi:MAG: MBL fold metallo-hydrolase [Pseudomonadota bacterium]
MEIFIIKVNIKAFKAKNGDAFLLNFENGQNILIDMGMPETYQIEIKDDLLKLKNKNESIDLLIISHIDEDHIGGAIKFIQDNQNGEIIQIKEIWHNSYKHIQFDKEKVKNIKQETKSILESFIMKNMSNNINGIQDITCEHGSSLASLIHKYNYNWNSSFNHTVICTKDGTTKTEVTVGDIKFILLSPNKEKLTKLSTEWLYELQKEKYNFEISDEEIFDDAFEFHMKYEQDNSSLTSDIAASNIYDFEELSTLSEKDKSATNGSSISFIIEYKDKKLLFLGDAHEDIIYDNLLKLQDVGYELLFNLVKIPHHGSNKNISNRLMALIRSDKFLISTNGTKHKHPNIEALAKIIVSNTDAKKEIIFNYDLDISQELNNEEYKSKYNYDIKHLNEIEI